MGKKTLLTIENNSHSSDRSEKGVLGEPVGCMRQGEVS